MNNNTGNELDKVRDNVVARYYSEALQANVCASIIEELDGVEVVLAIVLSHPENSDTILDCFDISVTYNAGSGFSDINMKELIETSYITYLTQSHPPAIN